jgi:hypothetical protein
MRFRINGLSLIGLPTLVSIFLFSPFDNISIAESNGILSLPRILVTVDEQNLLIVANDPSPTHEWESWPTGSGSEEEKNVRNGRSQLKHIWKLVAVQKLYRQNLKSSASKNVANSEGIKIAQYSLKFLKNLDEVMDLAAIDLWDQFPKGGNYRIAVASIKPSWMAIDDGLFRRVNNAFERALIRTGSESKNILLARSVLLSVLRVLEKEGLGLDPDTVRLKLLDQAIADVIVVADYHKARGGFDASFQAVRVKDGHVLAASREYRILLEQ